MKWITHHFKTQDVININGLTDELSALYINHYFKKEKQSLIVLTSSMFEATKYYEKLKTYESNVYLFPMDDFLTSVAIAVSPEFKVKRLETIQAIKAGEPCIIVTSLMGYLRFLPNKSTLDKSEISLSTNTELNRNYFEQLLEEFGYNKTSLVTSTGEYSVRGFIIDIYPINSEKPLRIELYGNIVENIREFDAETQLSLRESEKAEIYPYKELISSNYASLSEIMNNPVTFYMDHELVTNSYQKLQEEIFEYKKNNDISDKHKYMYELMEINSNKEIYINNFGVNNEKALIFNSQNVENFNSNYELLKSFVESKLNKYTIVFCLNDSKQINLINDLFDNKVILNDVIPNKINIIKETLNTGFVFENYIFITPKEIDGVETSPTKYHNTVKIGRKIKDFSDLQKGDYVVHYRHGIGIYNGVITLSKNGFEKDYILINYHGQDKVYIPVEKINTIYKYSDSGGVKPTIHKLASGAWEKAKTSVKAKIKDISEELIKLYAERSQAKTTKYLSFPEELLFDQDFNYQPTLDQIKCIEDIDQDLKAAIPMDRLLCGDVGFGKTEVAFRGIFKTIMNGFQVAYLCPTTILSKQQYENAKQRFKRFNLNIALLNRFTTAKEAKNILLELKIGKVDIVFGTHRLLNEQIEYHSLGLLIIDEEQRFGVTHKEKIKKLKNNVNVLTLSATPIPRTLKMAMSGLKDLSILDTAPQNRYPVQTYVLEENKLLMKDAIYKELSRNGQTYLLYNNVKNIEIKANEIKSLVPDARVCFAHGQMTKTQLENIIEDFVEHKYDVLVCSTIIETGMDIANVNTLIVIDAQNYGLSQLYQLRGRVGRSNRIAYAYLMYNPSKTLTETAIKRLKAIKEFTELGSGYKIAMRDLSIRGAGDLLGSEQAGFISSVGIDLYTRLVNEAMDELKGIYKPDNSAETALINVDTHIEESYVSDENVRIEIHKLINQIEDFSSLKIIKNEIEDRFGKISEKLNIYMYQEWFEKLANKLEIKQVTQTEERIEIILPIEISNQLNGEKLFMQVLSINPKFRLKYQMKRIHIILNMKDSKEHYIYDLVDLLKVINEQIA